MSEDQPGSRPGRAGDGGSGEPDPTPTDFQAAWDSIVAGWDAPAQPAPDPPGPPGKDHRKDPGPAAPPDPERYVDDPGLMDFGDEHPLVFEAGPRDYAPEPEDEGEFVPPEPPPLRTGPVDPVTVLAWAGVVGGPVLLLFSALFWRAMPAILVMAAVLAFVAGFVALVARLPSRRGDDGDDGARV